MKYIIILADGMADEAIPELGDKSPMEVANTPHMDALAKIGQVGLVQTVPEGMSPGSDVANLSVLGYDPKRYYTGRSSIEALSIGVPMGEGDVSYRANLVTLTEEVADYSEKRILDHSASEISTEDADVLLEVLKHEFDSAEWELFLGTSYRHLLLWRGGKCSEITPPHDVLGEKIAPFLPEEDKFREIMERSYEVLVNHPINIARKEKGLNPANSLWLWGAGTKPEFQDFTEKTGRRGAMISAVDLLKGIAVGVNMFNVVVEGATGGLHTNYEGKARAAVDVLLEQNYDFVYVHVEAADEMGHQGELEHKIQAIEWVDEKVLGVIRELMETSGEAYRILILPDHPTPVRMRTHTSEAVPFLLYDSTSERIGGFEYSESGAKDAGEYIEEGYRLLNNLLE